MQWFEGNYRRVIILDYLIIGLLSVFAWFFGSVAAGGAALIFIIVGSFFLPLPLIPILLSIIGSVSGAYRVFLYYSSINFSVAKWLVAGTLIGAFVGAQIFSSLIGQQYDHIIEMILSIVLFISGGYGLFSAKISKFAVRHSYYFLCSLVTSVLSSITGAGGIIINILFQRTPMSPKEIVGTKSFGNFTLQFAKLVFYGVAVDRVDILKLVPDMTGFGIGGLIFCGTIGSIIGSYLGKRYLDHIDTEKFDQIMNAAFILFGICFFLKSISFLYRV